MLFRRTNRYGYSRYYGNGGNILRVVKIILFVVVVLALGVALAVWLLRPYVTYDAEEAHLNLPWTTVTAEADSSSGTEPEVLVEDGSGSSAADPEVVVNQEDADASAAEEGSSSVAPEEDADEESDTDEGRVSAALTQLLGQHVGKINLKSGYSPSTLRAAGANAALIYLKESSGSLNFFTENALATQLGVVTALDTDEDGNSYDAILTAAAALQEEGYYTVAYVDCFRDKALGSNMDYSILSSDGSRWKDRADAPWASPSNEAVQDYLVSLVTEIAEAGFDEVVLRNAAYPTLGDTDAIADDSDRTEVITAFYEKLIDALADYDIVLSVYTDEATINTGENVLSGQTLAELSRLGGRLWVNDATDADALESALTEADFGENTLCLVVDDLDTNSTLSQCVTD
ncbi:MAG: putative glycoside hydrolase [Clostridiales bacterium]|nr:putative glycoside hydrolase [Clostridiales bacterium]